MAPGPLQRAELPGQQPSSHRPASRPPVTTGPWSRVNSGPGGSQPGPENRPAGWVPGGCARAVLPVPLVASPPLCLGPALPLGSPWSPFLPLRLGPVLPSSPTGTVFLPRPDFLRPPAAARSSECPGHTADTPWPRSPPLTASRRLGSSQKSRWPRRNVRGQEDPVVSGPRSPLCGHWGCRRRVKSAQGGHSQDPVLGWTRPADLVPPLPRRVKPQVSVRAGGLARGPADHRLCRPLKVQRSQRLAPRPQAPGRGDLPAGGPLSPSLHVFLPASSRPGSRCRSETSPLPETRPGHQVSFTGLALPRRTR